MRTILPVSPTPKILEATQAGLEDCEILIGLTRALDRARRHKELSDRDLAQAERNAVYEQWIKPLTRLTEANAQDRQRGGDGFLTEWERELIDGIQTAFRLPDSGNGINEISGDDAELARILLDRFKPALAAEDRFPDRRHNTDGNGHCDDVGEADYTRLILAASQCPMFA